MVFRKWLEQQMRPQVMAVVSGPPASGKSTFIQAVHQMFPGLLVKDLDEIIGDNVIAQQSQAMANMQDPQLHQAKMQLHQAWQIAINQFLGSVNQPVVLVGTTFVDIDTPELQIPTRAKFYFNVSPQDLWSRKLGRKDAMPADQQEFMNITQQQIAQYQNAGYTRAMPQQVLQYLSSIMQHNGSG